MTVNVRELFDRLGPAIDTLGKRYENFLFNQLPNILRQIRERRIDKNYDSCLEAHTTADQRAAQINAVNADASGPGVTAAPLSTPQAVGKPGKRSSTVEIAEKEPTTPTLPTLGQSS